MARKAFRLKPLPSLNGPPWLRPAHRRREIDLQWLVVAFVLAGVGLIYFGVEAMKIVAVTAAAALAAYVGVGLILWAVRWNQAKPAWLYGLWSGALLGLCMPVTGNLIMPTAAGLMLGVLANLIGRTHRLRIAPVAVVMAVVWLGPPTLGRVQLDVPGWMSATRHDVVLRPPRLVVGDINSYSPQVSTLPWLRSEGPFDAVRRSDPGRLIAREQRRMLVDGDLLPSMLADGRLPAMQEMVIGAVPGPIGGTSPAVLIFVGLYLMYRQMASWRGALAALVGALAAWLILPLWIDKTLTIPLLCLVDLGILGSITLMGYVVLSQPLPLIVLVLAPSVQPLARRGRIAFGLLLGAAVVTAIWFIGRPEAGYLGLVAVGLFSRSLDRLHRSPYVR